MRGAPSLVLGYHRVAAERDPYAICVQPAHFAEHLDVLDELAAVVPLDHLAADDRGRQRPGPRVAITFDDGYADNAEVAAPLLRGHSFPATVFVATSILDGGGEFWWDRLDHLLLDDVELATGTLAVTIAGRPLTVDIRSESGRRRALRAVNLRLNGLPMPVIERVLGQIQEQLGVDPDLAGCRRHRRLSAAGVRTMVGDGLVEVGGHTRTHTALSALDERQQRDEIEGCRADLADITGRRAASFAYPYGVPAAFTDMSARIVRRSGFARAFTTSRGRVTRFGDRYRAPRFMVPGCDGAAFRQQLASWLAA